MSTPQASPSSRCPKCGAAAETGARFCGECGEKLGEKIGDKVAEKIAPVAAPRPVAKVASAPALATPAPVVVKPTAAKPAVAAAKPAAKPAVNPAVAMLDAPPPSSTAPAPVAPGGPTALQAPIAKTPAPVSVSVSGKDGGRVRSVDKLIGRTLNNRYVVEAKIGEGGFGAVFRGKQIATGREVALKLLHPHNLTDTTVVARFRREAEACSKLRDPHTVITYDFDETEDGVLYLAMELLRGKSLQQLQKAEGAMDGNRVLSILDQVAQALGEAHGQGIVHRDMKPENVMVERRGEDDFVKVLDFGIAKVMSGGASKSPALTAIGQTVGTLEFMSPEQLRGKALDGRSDIYALGMMAYEMLTGELPFKNAKSPTEIIEFHLQKPAPPPSQLVPDLKIPAHVDEVVLKMVAKKPEDRHANVEELREHIEKALASADGAVSRKELVRVVAVVGGILAVVGTVLALLAR